jgi:hypothetical protein
MADTLFYIPDISGFTEFVHGTELSHSQHIVAELLELIIENENLGLTAAEIEGDAILFYTQKNIPDATRIIKETEKLFVKFHEHLAYYNQRRVCDCGACRTASGLSLKFIVHRGEAELLKVKNFIKPYGSAVIGAHRLMKNSIPSDEYLLMTDSVFSGEKDETLKAECPWIMLDSGSETYSSLGEVPYRYIELKSLHKQVPLPPPAPTWTSSMPQLTSNIEIACAPDRIYSVVMDLSRRAEIQKGIKRIDHNKNEITRIGTEHVCILPVGKSTFETIRTPATSTARLYAEKTKSIPFVKEFTQLISINETPTGSIVEMQGFFQPSGWVGNEACSLLF